MTSAEREKFLKDKLNEIRDVFHDEFDKIGMLHIAVDYDYISAFSSTYCESGEDYVDFHVFYNMEGGEG